MAVTRKDRSCKTSPCSGYTIVWTAVLHPTGSRIRKHMKMCCFIAWVLMLAVVSCISDGKNALPVGLWEDATRVTIGATDYWTNKVELADINGDGLVDILCAIGGKEHEPGVPEISRVYLNQGPGKRFKEVSREVFGSTVMLARVIKVRDVNGDGNPDIAVGTTYQTQSRLYLGDGSGYFTDVTATHFPHIKASVGDLEFGDVDDDGDLDIVLADWGPGNPAENDGGRTMLWLNEENGHFSDATRTCMPDVLVKFSWELEFVDVDNDYDLDILVSAVKSDGSFLFENDGKGNFTDLSKNRLPQYANNFDFEAMDLNGDGYLDLMTINDGEVFEGKGSPRRQHVFLNNQRGGFEDVSPTHWPDSENPPYDDNIAVYLDYDSDGDSDVVIASLTGPDRLLINDGAGHLRQAPDVFTGGGPTPGTLYMALADLNGDNKLDVVEAAGESEEYRKEGGFEDKVYFGTNISPDTAPPVITMVEKISASKPLNTIRIRARVHDNKSPTTPFDWKAVVLRWTANGQTREKPMKWYGEYLWRSTIDHPSSGTITYRVCATDAAGNETSSPLQTVIVK